MRWFKKPESNQSAQKSKDELHKYYWRNPDDMNITSGHLLGGRRSEYLVSLVKQYVKPDVSILERKPQQLFISFFAQDSYSNLFMTSKFASEERFFFCIYFLPFLPFF